MIINSSDILKLNNSLIFNGYEKIQLSIDDSVKDIDIDIKSNSKVEILLLDFKSVNINFFIQNDAILILKIINNNIKKTLNLKANLCRNSIFNTFLADLVDGDIEINSNVILYDDFSSSEFKFSTLAKNKNNKRYNISFSHIGKNTHSILSGFGVSQNEALIKCVGVSHIEKGSIKSNAKQSVKVILFDKESKAIASPTLKIDCDDIKASHGCAIGALNEEHLFYLLSRGIDLTEARKLITTGYLMPIANYFEDELKQKIVNEINGSL